MVSGQAPRRDMRRDRQRQRRRDKSEHVLYRLADLRPLDAELAPGHCSKFVQNLNADKTARRQQRPRLFGLGPPLLRVNENIRIKKGIHRSLASSRSNL